jgi:D-aminoacyl-tRNA deacylase
MRLLLTRVNEASVKVGNQKVGEINKGLLALCGFDENDVVRDIRWSIEKAARLRIFNDDSDRMNLSAKELQLPLLLISQFTLLAQVIKGNRPSFNLAAAPAEAEVLYEETILIARENFTHLETGIFGEDMQVLSVNDGPVTFLIDSREKFPV